MLVWDHSALILVHNPVAVLVAVVPTFVLFAARHCNDGSVNIYFILNALCAMLRPPATPCKTAKNGLKIRWPQGRGGSSPPPGTKLF